MPIVWEVPFFNKFTHLKDILWILCFLFIDATHIICFETNPNSDIYVQMNENMCLSPLPQVLMIYFISFLNMWNLRSVWFSVSLTNMVIILEQHVIFYLLQRCNKSLVFEDPFNVLCNGFGRYSCASINLGECYKGERKCNQMHFCCTMSPTKCTCWSSA